MITLAEQTLFSKASTAATGITVGTTSKAGSTVHSIVPPGITLPFIVRII